MASKAGTIEAAVTQSCPGHLPNMLAWEVEEHPSLVEGAPAHGVMYGIIDGLKTPALAQAG